MNADVQVNVGVVVFDAEGRGGVDIDDFMSFRVISRASCHTKDIVMSHVERSHVSRSGDYCRFEKLSFVAKSSSRGVLGEAKNLLNKKGIILGCLVLKRCHGNVNESNNSNGHKPRHISRLGGGKLSSSRITRSGEPSNDVDVSFGGPWRSDNQCHFVTLTTLTSTTP